MNMESKKKEPERVWRNEKRHWAAVERDMRLVSPAGGWIPQSHGGDGYILRLRCFGGMGAGGIGLVSHMHETCRRVDFSYRKETASLQWRRTVPLRAVPGDYYMTDAFMHKCRRWLEGSGVCIPT